MSRRPPRCFVVSAPSGAGKTSLAVALVGRVAAIEQTVSCTTREARAGEEEGVDYFFVTPEAFEQRVAEGAFLEHAQVHQHRYGTLRGEVGRIHAAGHDALLVIDVQGAATLREHLPDAVTVFVLPPSQRSLVERLQGRDGGDGDAALRGRMAAAADEIAQYVSYDYLVINDDFETALAELAAIVQAERCRTRYRRGTATELLDEFRATAAD